MINKMILVLLFSIIICTQSVEFSSPESCLVGQAYAPISTSLPSTPLFCTSTLWTLKVHPGTKTISTVISNSKQIQINQYQSGLLGFGPVIQTYSIPKPGSMTLSDWNRSVLLNPVTVRDLSQNTTISWSLLYLPSPSAYFWLYSNRLPGTPFSNLSGPLHSSIPPAIASAEECVILGYITDDNKVNYTGTCRDDSIKYNGAVTVFPIGYELESLDVAVSFGYGYYFTSLIVSHTGGSYWYFFRGQSIALGAGVAEQEPNAPIMQRISILALSNNSFVMLGYSDEPFILQIFYVKDVDGGFQDVESKNMIISPNLIPSSKIQMTYKNGVIYGIGSTIGDGTPNLILISCEIDANTNITCQIKAGNVGLVPVNGQMVASPFFVEDDSLIGWLETSKDSPTYSSLPGSCYPEWNFSGKLVPLSSLIANPTPTPTPGVTPTPTIVTPTPGVTPTPTPTPGVTPTPTPIVTPTPTPGVIVIPPNVTVPLNSSNVNVSIIVEGGLLVDKNISINGNLTFQPNSTIVVTPGNTAIINGCINFGGTLQLNQSCLGCIQYDCSNSTFNSIKPTDPKSDQSVCSVNYGDKSLTVILGTQMECGDDGPNIAVVAGVTCGVFFIALILAIILSVFFRDRLAPYARD